MDKEQSIMNGNFLDIAEKINNSELKKILSYVKNEPLFFDEEHRLLSYDEINNYKKELGINLNVIPLVDCFDNSFLVYNLDDNEFQMIDISEETIYKHLESIEDIINKIENANK